MSLYQLLKNNTKLARKRSLHRLRIFLRYCGQRTAKEPVFILTTRRTGSNLLLDYLNSVPGASFAPEILNKSMYYGIRRRHISKAAVLRHIRHSINACATAFCGAKLVDVHLRTHGVTAQDLLKLYPQARFILLYRRSLVEQFVSLKIAERTDAWQWSENSRPPSRLHISLGELKAYCRKTKMFYGSLLKQGGIEGRSILLSYEDLASDAQQVFDRRLFAFLGQPSMTVLSGMVKQNTRPLCEIIENYAEIEPFMDDALARQDYSSQPRLVRRRATQAA